MAGLDPLAVALAAVDGNEGAASELIETLYGAHAAAAREFIAAEVESAANGPSDLRGFGWRDGMSDAASAARRKWGLQIVDPPFLGQASLWYGPEDLTDGQIGT